MKNIQAHSMKTKVKHYIGIDPGKTTGFALYTVRGNNAQLMKVTSHDFWTVIGILQSITDDESKEIHKGNVKIIIEDPNLNAPTFVRKGANVNQMMKIAQYVGMNKREASLIIQQCNILKLHVVPCRPKTKKKDAFEFTKITSWFPQTNEHGRDAAMLVYGL